MNKEEFIRIGRVLFDMGLAGSHSGSLSIREGDNLFITKKDAMLSSLVPDDIIEAPVKSEEKNELCSVDLPAHRAVYNCCDATAIIGAFAASAAALSISAEGKIIPLDLEGQSSLRSIPIARVREGGSVDDISKILPSIFSSGYVTAIIRGSGSYAIGKSLDEALKRISQLEYSSEVVLYSKILNNKPAISKPAEHHRKTAIPPSIGVMDRSYGRGLDRGRGGRR